jgi:hypothetical protein
VVTCDFTGEKSRTVKSAVNLESLETAFPALKRVCNSCVKGKAILNCYVHLAIDDEFHVHIHTERGFAWGRPWETSHQVSSFWYITTEITRWGQWVEERDKTTSFRTQNDWQSSNTFIIIKWLAGEDLSRRILLWWPLLREACVRRQVNWVTKLRVVCDLHSEVPQLSRRVGHVLRVRPVMSTRRLRFHSNKQHNSRLYVRTAQYWYEAMNI